MNDKTLSFLVMCLLIDGAANAVDSHKQADDVGLPEVASRTYAQNYKDLALSTCIAQAYAGEPKAVADAGATAGGLESTWTNYDVEKGGGEIQKLVDHYLKRQYNSIQGPDIKLDLLKCLDMYHSKELEAQVRRYVPNSNRTYKQENPPSK